MSQRLNVRPAVGAQKEFCEEQDERVTKCGILSSVRAPVWPHRAHRSLSLPEIKGLIITSGPTGDSLPALHPTVGARKLIKQVGHPKGHKCDLHTWENPSDVGKELLGRKVLHKISSILLVKAKCYKSDLVA